MNSNLRPLTNGETIELKSDQASYHFTVESWVQEVVGERKIRVVAKKRLEIPKLKQQHELTAIARRDNGLYQMQATIQEILETETDLILLLDLHSDIEQIQRRQFYRLPLLKEVAINLVGDPPMPGLTQNLSAGGLKCQLRQEIRIGATVEVTLEIEGTSLNLKAQVLECAPMANVPHHTSIRVQFTTLTTKEQQLLTAYIFKQQGKREAKIKREAK